MNMAIGNDIYHGIGNLTVPTITKKVYNTRRRIKTANDGYNVGKEFGRRRQYGIKSIDSDDNIVPMDTDND